MYRNGYSSPADFSERKTPARVRSEEPHARPAPGSSTPTVEIFTAPPSLTALRRSWSHFGNLPPNLVFGIVGSGLVHVTAVVLATIAFSAFSSLRVYPPTPGVASIQLVASFEAAPNASEAGDLPAVEIVMERQVTETPATTALAETLDHCVIEAPERPISPLRELPARMLARAPLTAAPELVAVASPAEKTVRARQPQAMPRPQPADRPLRKKPDVQPPPTDTTARVEAEPATASTASQASRGARSTVAIRTLYSPAPEYPPEALSARLTGRVVLRVAVDREGRVTRAAIYRSSGVPSLDASALATVRRWRFEPMQDAGAAETTELGVPIRFRIE